MSTHAILAPSASERWINCPISVHLSEGFEDTTSVYAAEGTLAHKLAELKVRQEIMGETVPEESFKAVRTDPLYAPDMEEHTDSYIEQIREIYNRLDEPFAMAETRLELSKLVGGDCFGTADFIICAPGEIHVFDFKYGKNVEVSAEDNSQMRLYALGAVELFDMLYGIELVHCHIIQPRMNNFSSEVLNTKALTKWLDLVVRPAALQAVNAEGNPAKGPWCQFCQAKAVCREYGREYETPPGREEPARLSDQEIGFRIAMLEGIDAYLKELKDYALSTILNGGAIPGYKAVEGRSLRTWTDQDKAFEAAEKAGYDRTVLYENKPLSLSKIEKMMGKKKFADILGGFVDKPQGKPTLVKDSDKREPFVRLTAQEDFKGINPEF